MTVVERLSRVLDGRISRRSFVVRSAFAGSALAAGGTDFLLKPGTAYASLCYCGDPGCGCDTTCCVGYTEFCCVLDGGYNSCPADTVMGGWWMAEGSVYCSGPRYYMDCNGVCECTDGCGDGYQFCDTGCDGLDCGCADGSCDNYLTGCFQFRYGQCNQDVSCIGRIKCRVVTCVPPWEVDPSCTTASAEDDYTANQNADCLSPGPTYPPPPGPPPPPPCPSPATQCAVVGMAITKGGLGYGIVTSFGKEFPYGNELAGSFSGRLNKPIVAIVTSPEAGYWMVAADGGIFDFHGAPFFGSAGGDPPAKPVVAMVATPSGKGYWLTTSIGNVLPYGDAPNHGGTQAVKLNQPIVGMASTITGKGYWLVAADGGVFTFGDAKYHGGAEGAKLNQPVVGMATTATGNGYWLVAGDGGIFTFGDAKFYGSTGAAKLNRPIVGMAATPTGDGYYLVGQDGGIFTFGDAKFHGSAA
jgi:ribosomal protein L24E